MKKGKNILALVLIFLMLFPYTEDTNIVNVEVTAEDQKENDDSSSKNESLVGEFYKKMEKPLESLSRNILVYEKEEYRLKAEALATESYLETKTDDNYEVALSFSDGDYSFVNSTNSYDEAFNIVNNIEKQQASADAVPVVINYSGENVYATNSMARIIGGQGNTILYADSDLTEQISYINALAVEDVPIIDQTEKSSLILVNGLKAWVNSDFNKNSEIEVYPLTDVNNPSYYSVSNGILNHFLSADLRANYKYGTTISIGQAPSFLKEGIKYYSYDGNYFYEDLNQLISDLKGNHNNNSVNSGNPFYNYYQYLPFRTTTTHTADEINDYLYTLTEDEKYLYDINPSDDVYQGGNLLRGTGEAFINSQNEYGVNALLLLGIAINESGVGTSDISKEKKNIFGLGAIDEDAYNAAYGYSSVEACIDDYAKNWISGYWADPLARDYGGIYYGGHLGNKANGANVTYASDPYWGEKAAQWAFELDNNLNRKDVDLYQLAIFTSKEDIYGEDGTYLYTAEAGEPTSIISDNVNGVYKIYPDRTMPIFTGEWMTYYDWSYKGQVSSDKIKFINERADENLLTKGISYKTHVQDYGWQEWKYNGETSGTEGESKRLEGIEILLDNSIKGASIKYQTHVQDYGWQSWKSDGQLSGTMGESKRLEAIRIKLENAEGYKVEYRVHVQDYGWQEWKSNGEIAGTEGESKRLEAIEIRGVKEPSIEYRTHVQDYGWQEWKSNGGMSGTVGESKRLESIELKLTDFPEGSNIVYQTHIQDYGWQDWKKDGQMSGTTGESKRLEAIKIKLENAPGYKVEYRVHVQDYGWQEWKSNGELAGTEGESKRLEGIEIRVVKK